MQFNIGPIPDNTDFNPETEGWTPIREPGPCLLQILAVPLVLIIFFLLGGILFLFWPPDTTSPSLPLLILLVLALFPIHELLHAIVFPHGLSSPHTIIGFWPSRFVFYAHYDNAMDRNRFLLVFFVPFFLLSIVPIMVISLFQWPSVELAVLALINAAAASGDMMGILLIGLQVPRSAVVRNQGWRSYWKSKEKGDSHIIDHGI